MIDLGRLLTTTDRSGVANHQPDQENLIIKGSERSLWTGVTNHPPTSAQKKLNIWHVHRTWWLFPFLFCQSLCNPTPAGSYRSRRWKIRPVRASSLDKESNKRSRRSRGVRGRDSGKNEPPQRKQEGANSIRFDSRQRGLPPKNAFRPLPIVSTTKERSTRGVGLFRSPV